MDILVVVSTIVFFAATLLYVTACDRLGSAK